MLPFRTMLTKLRHFHSIHDALLWLRMIGLWCLLPLILLLPLKRVLALLTPRTTSAALRHLPPEARKQKILFFASYWFSRPFVAARNSCLKSSLLLYAYFNRYGIPANFSVGIRRAQNGELEGHSWIKTSIPGASPYQNHDTFICIYTYPEAPVENFRIA